MLKIFKYIDNGIEHIMKFVLPLLINGIVILMVIQICLRYCLHMPMKSIEEILTLPVIWLYFIGAINASKTETHISARLLDVFCKTDRQLAVLRCITAFISIFISIWFVYLSHDLLEYSMRVQKTSMILHYPLLLVEAMPMLCFVLMTFYSIAETAKYFKIATCRKIGDEK